MKNAFKLTLLLLSVAVTGCSKESTPDQVLIDFLESGRYELLSEKDKDIWSEEEWYEHSNNQILPQPQLLPTNKFYELEQYLHSFISYEVVDMQDLSDAHEVTVEYNWPEVLTEVDFFSDYALEYKLEEIENLQRLYEQDLLLPTAITLSTNKSDFTIYSSGVYLDLASIQAAKNIREEINQKFEELKHIDTYDLGFDFHREETWQRQIDALRRVGINQIRSDFDAYREAILFALERDENFTPFFQLRTLSKLKIAILHLEADEFYSQNLVFENAKVSESTRRGKGLFFDWKFKDSKSLHEKSSAGIIAKYYDDEGTQIGSDTIFRSSINTANGNQAGSVGRVIENQNMARRVSSVEVEYHMPFGFISLSCKYEEVLICD